jgi:hypothetical protein
MYYIRVVKQRRIRMSIYEIAKEIAWINTIADIAYGANLQFESFIKQNYPEYQDLLSLDGLDDQVINTWQSCEARFLNQNGRLYWINGKIIKNGQEYKLPSISEIHNNGTYVRWMRLCKLLERTKKEFREFRNGGFGLYRHPTKGICSRLKSICFDLEKDAEIAKKISSLPSDKHMLHNLYGTWSIKAQARKILKHTFSEYGINSPDNTTLDMIYEKLNKAKFQWHQSPG